MAKQSEEGKAKPSELLNRLFGRTENEKGEPAQGEDNRKPSDPQPSLETIGLTDCSVCGQEVSVLLTKTHHPFTACGRCGARTFYNSSVAIRILKRRLRELNDD